MVDNSPGEMALTGWQHQELPTKSSQIRGPGREQWAKCRVSQFSFTQQLAENQQVGIAQHSTQTTRGESHHEEAERENSSANDQNHERTNQRWCNPNCLCSPPVLLEHLFDTLAL
ncbi:hypothetical protein CesoFtcFv8_017653 [Champsocephalus esox]|uniref:Uncharacterized protein n=1 Tax=Champsocephalus esox TaxID=159716 RepID=A0AAN8GP40_9TELE|nr:hypothetical protein CesoFtcFv8_017653 [Champsocephalus esox]